MMEINAWALVHHRNGIDLSVVGWKAKDVKAMASTRSGVPWSGMQSAGYRVLPIVIVYESAAPGGETSVQENGDTDE